MLPGRARRRCTGLRTLADLTHNFILEPVNGKTNIENGDQIRIKLVEPCAAGKQYIMGTVLRAPNTLEQIGFKSHIDSAGTDAVMSSIGDVFIIKRGPISA